MDWQDKMKALLIFITWLICVASVIITVVAMT